MPFVDKSLELVEGVPTMLLCYISAQFGITVIGYGIQQVAAYVGIFNTVLLSVFIYATAPASAAISTRPSLGPRFGVDSVPRLGVPDPFPDRLASGWLTRPSCFVHHVPGSWRSPYRGFIARILGI